MEILVEGRPLAVGAVIVDSLEPVGQNWKTRVLRVKDAGLVLKEHRGMADSAKRKRSESNDAYYLRRLRASIEFIKREKIDEQIVSGFLPTSVKAPKEQHFISEDGQGYPMAYRVQEFVQGRRLKDVDKSELSAENQQTLDALVEASIRSYLATGRVVDLTGWSGSRKGLLLGIIPILLQPIDQSANILLDSNGQVALIDVKSQIPGNSLVRKLGRLVYFLGLVREKTKRDRRKKNNFVKIGHEQTVYAK